MTAGGYQTWDDPSGMGVYVDGRLEVYDTPFFAAYMSHLGNVAIWRKEADARGIQSVMIFHRWANRHGFIRQLVASSDWRLVYYDETVVIFVRAAGNEDTIAAARKSFDETWLPQIEKELTSPVQNYPWQWSIGRYTGQLAFARVLETIGQLPHAVEWLAKALETGLYPSFEIQTRQQLANYLAEQDRYAEARMHLEKAHALDPSDELTNNMLTKLDEITRDEKKP
jgi:tetratricopeptide (TPR) repeat protein